MSKVIKTDISLLERKLASRLFGIIGRNMFIKFRLLPYQKTLNSNFAFFSVSYLDTRLDPLYNCCIFAINW